MSLFAVCCCVACVGVTLWDALGVISLHRDLKKAVKDTTDYLDSVTMKAAALKEDFPDV